jgi:outer membrane usher protein
LALLAAAILVASAAAGAQDQRALLSVSVNNVEKGEVLVFLRDHDVLIGVESLAGVGITGFAGTRESIGDTAFVSLASLAPDVTYQFDERALSLHLTAVPHLLETVVRDLAAGRPPDIEFRRDTSAYANYSVNLRGRSDYDLFSDVGISTRGAFVNTTLSYGARQSVTRGLSSATFDQRTKMRRFVAGDAFASGGLLGGGVLLGGFTVVREFATDPYFVRFPAFNLTGAVATPSTIEVYVNDRLVGTEQVVPGQFALNQLPITNGRNDARIVIRDAFGGVRDMSTSYYLTTSVLARGLNEYQYSLGYERRNFGVENWSYGPLAFVGRHRVGLTDNITLGGRLEAREDLASGGPGVNIRTPFGEFEAAAALSRTGALRGRAISGAYTYAGQAFSVGAAARAMSQHYVTTSLGVAQEKPELETSGFVSIRLGPRVSMTLQRLDASMYFSPALVRTALITSGRINGRLDAFVTGSVERGTLLDAPGTRREIFAGMSVRIGANTLASVSTERVGNADQIVTELQQPLPVGAGWGFRLYETSGDRDFSSGAFRYQGPYGRYELRRDSTDGGTQTTLNASGGLVAMSGGLYASRPIQDGFALVRVPDVPGVRAYASNQEVGRTNGDGNLLVPNLLSYYGNVLNISDQDVPLEHKVGTVRKIVAPPYRGGALVVFPVERVQGATGVLQLDIGGETIAPAYGQLSVQTGAATIDSPIGERGEFYLENLPPGPHEAVLRYRDLSCRFTLTMPVSNAPAVDLGTVRCRAGAR